MKIRLRKGEILMDLNRWWSNLLIRGVFYLLFIFLFLERKIFFSYNFIIFKFNLNSLKISFKICLRFFFKCVLLVFGFFCIRVWDKFVFIF